MIVAVWESELRGTKLAEVEMAKIEFDVIVSRASSTPYELDERLWRVHGWGSDTFRAEDGTPLLSGFLVVMEWTP